MVGFNLLFKCNYLKYIEDIYFFEVNTKYISSSAVKKKSVFFTSYALVKMLIFSLHEMKYIWYLPKKSKFSFYFILKAQPNFFHCCFSFDLTFSVCRKWLKLYFNERNARNQHLKKVY